MKKVTRILGMACLAGMLVFTASCKKDQENTSMNVTIPQMTAGHIEGERAYLNEDWEFRWNQNDEICVYNLSDEYDESTMQIFRNISGEGPTAYFAGPDVGAPKTYGYYYFYPTTMISGDLDELANENRQTVTVDQIQNWETYWTDNHEGSMVDASQMPMAIQSPRLDQNATLMHMFGMGVISLKAKRNTVAEVSTITITDNAFALWGTASLRMHDVDPEYLTQKLDEYADGDLSYEELYDLMQEQIGWLAGANEGHNSIILNCMHLEDNEMVGQVVATTPNYTDFAFMLRPLALSAGFTVDVEFANGLEPLHIASWIAPNLDYAIRPAVYNTWKYSTAIEGVR